MSSHFPIGMNRRRGVSSLVELCTRRIVTVCNQLEKEHLENVPSTRKIFRYLEDETNDLNLAAWKLLAPKITVKEDAARHVCRHVLRYSTISVAREHQEPLTAYIKQATSDTFDFLTQLTIAGEVRCDTPELLLLVQLKNLTIFEAIQPSDEGGRGTFPLVTDSVIREWSKAADPFPVLRVLRVWGMDFTTRRSLQYLDAFPSLVLYDVAGRERDWAEVDADYAWKCTKRWSWHSSFKGTLCEHINMLQEHLWHDRWKIKPGNETKYVDDLIDALSDPRRGVYPFQRAAQDLHDEVPRQDEYLLPKPPDDKIRDMGQKHQEDNSEALLDCNEIWGFLMYCHIGRILANRDLAAQGLDIPDHGFSLGKIIYPPRPLLSIRLGDSPHHHVSVEAKRGCPRGSRCREDYKKRAGSYETQLTFIREAYDQDRRVTHGKRTKEKTDDSGGSKRPRVTQTTTRRPLKKRRDVSSILQSFSED